MIRPREPGHWVLEDVPARPAERRCDEECRREGLYVGFIAGAAFASALMLLMPCGH